MEQRVKQILEKYINNPSILNIYMHGSRVYQTNTDKSDYDFIIVIEDYAYTEENIQEEICDFNCYKKSTWLKMCEDNNLDFCECYFLPKEYVLKETFKPKLILSTQKIRANFSHVSSNSYVKCKKKLTIEKDYAPYIGKKSLWHSFRILMFGIQVLSERKIKDYKCANYLYNEIVNCENNDWQYFKDKYQQLYNTFRSEFRKFDNL